MQNVKHRRLINPSPAVIAVMFAMVVVACLFAFFSRESFYKQVRNTLALNTQKVAEQTHLSLRYARTSIMQASGTVSRKMDGPVLQNSDLNLALLVKQTPFSKLDYTRSDGINVVEGDSTNVSNKEFFLRGMVGETGLVIEYHSKKSQEAIVRFFTPLVYKDSIVGVLSGMMGGKSDIRSMLDYKIYGENIVGVLCDNHMNIISSNVIEDDYGMSFEKKAIEFLPQEVVEKIKKAATLNNSEPFRFSMGLQSSIVSVTRLNGTGWVVIQMLPYHVLSDFTFSVVLRVSLAILAVSVLFVFYLISVYRGNRRLRSEIENRHLNVIDALAESYGSVFVIDLKTGLGVVYRVNPRLQSIMNDILNGRNQYNQVMSLYVNRMVLPEDRSLFDRVMTLESLNREFYIHDHVEFVYRVGVGKTIHYIQAHFVKPSKDRPELVVGFKIVDESMRAEIEKRRELNDQRMALVKALDNAQKADRAKSKFLFSMSHDIRTPMNAMLGYGSLAKNLLWKLNCSKDDTLSLNHYLDNIQIAGGQLLDMIDSVLDMARIESGVETLNEYPFFPMELSDNLMVVFERALVEKNIMLQISRNIKDRCVMGDKMKLQQIVLNVVSNAIKFTRKNGVVRVSFNELPHENPNMCNLEMVVEDTGVGISESFLPRIFNDFEREESAMTRGIKGSGLGLSIVKKLLDLMHGSIKVTSRVGQGTKVVVVTPHRISKDYAPISEGDATSYSDKLGGKKILLVDDDAMTLEIVGNMLKNAGAIVTNASDGMECCRYMEQEPAGTFDAILMDILMPGMDGFETTRKIRSMTDPKKSGIFIFAMTANAFDEERRSAIISGMNGHISKPIDFARLFEMLSSSLN